MQPSHAIGDFYSPSNAWVPIGSPGALCLEVAARLTGAIVAAGSDAPVEKGDPRIEFYAAVARRSPHGLQPTPTGISSNESPDNRR